MTSQLSRYWYTAECYRPGQIFARLSTRLKQEVMRRVPALGRRYLAKGNVSESGAVLFRHFDSKAVLSGRMEVFRNIARDVHENRFTFLNRTREFGAKIDWASPNESRLWRYNLHYADYTRALALVFAHDDNHEVIADLRRIVGDWIIYNPVGIGIGWHAYPTSLRIVNWLYALHLCGNTLRTEIEFYKRMLHSLYSQAAFLAKHLELDSLGNHLLKNAKALTLAGLCFSGSAPAHWLAIGTKILWEQLGEQILLDGGHYERSPMYHTIVLSDYLEVLAALWDNKISVPEHVPPKIEKMAEWLATMLHPDGEIPLLQDSVLGIDTKPMDVLKTAQHLLSRPLYGKGRVAGGFLSALLRAHAKGESGKVIESPFVGVKHLSESGYVVFQGAAPGDKMILDGKGIEPDHVPAHGHCGLFSFELSVNGQRVVVDSGVGTYEPGPWRDYYRSTRAHNTIEIDGKNQSDVWSAFRVGRRACVQFNLCKQGDGFSAFIGKHDGYTHLKFGLFHMRCVFALDEGAWLIFDRTPGDGGHDLISYFHLHPYVEARRLDSHMFELVRGSTRLRLMVLGAAEGSVVKGHSSPLQGWYASQFGLDQPCLTLSVQFTGQEPSQWGCAILPLEWPVPRVDWTFVEDACEFAFQSGNVTRKGRISANSEG